MMTYTTKSGDMWDSIALEVYGDTKFTDDLIRANAEYRKTYIFQSGVTLSVPEIDEKITYEDLPPWKQVNG